MKLDPKLWAQRTGKFLNDYSHTTIGSAFAAAALTYHLKTGRDLGSNFVIFSAYFYGFLLGHAGVNQKWPDPPDPSAGARASGTS